jgi:N4-gp56 family major capsid protein
MAYTEFATGHALSPTIWERELAAEAIQQTYVWSFMGNSKNSLLVQRDDFSTKAGDRIIMGLRAQLTGRGTTGDDTLHGNEEALVTHNDEFKINQLRHAVISKGRMSEQRVMFNMRTEAKEGLTDWFATRFDTWFFNQIGGATYQTDLAYTGFNAVAPVDANHIIRPNSEASDEALAGGDEISLTVLDSLAARLRQGTYASTGVMPMRPIRIRGGNYYVLFVHPNQVRTLRGQTSDGQWADIQKAQIQGGNNDVSLVTGGDFVGIYNGIIIHQSEKVPYGVNSTTGAAVTNVRRAILCGAQAAMFGIGADTPDDTRKFKWIEERFDYENQLGVSAYTIAGLKASRFASARFGTFILPTYAPLS